MKLVHTPPFPGRTDGSVLAPIPSANIEGKRVNIRVLSSFTEPKIPLSICQYMDGIVVSSVFSSHQLDSHLPIDLPAGSRYAYRGDIAYALNEAGMYQIANEFAHLGESDETFEFKSGQYEVVEEIVSVTTD